MSRMWGPSEVLRDRKIVHFEAPAPDEARVLAGDQGQAIAPSLRQDGRGLVNTA